MSEWRNTIDRSIDLSIESAESNRLEAEQQQHHRLDWPTTSSMLCRFRRRRRVETLI